MTYPMRRTAGLLAAIGFAAATGAAAQETGFDTWDKDGDGRISRTEFQSGPAGLQPEAAEPAAPRGDASEIQSYDLSAFDADRDGTLSQAEFERAAVEAGFGDRFGDWDANRDGMISPEEYMVGYARSGPAPASVGVGQERRAAESRYDLPNWDANQDGRLDGGEFARLRAEMNILENLSTFDLDRDGALSDAEYARVPRRTAFEGGGVAGDRPYYAFEEWDADGDGFLDRSEYTAFEARRLDAASGGIMANVDANGDGAVTRAEYESWARGYRRGPSGEGAPRFTAFDTDRDGVIDLGEMSGLRNALSRF